MQQLVDELQVDLSDPGAATWSETELLQFLNDAVKDYSVYFPRVARVDVVTAVADRRYNLPSDYVGLVSVEYPADETLPSYLVRKDYFLAWVLG